MEDINQNIFMKLLILKFDFHCRFFMDPPLSYTNQSNFSLADSFLGQSTEVKLEKLSFALDPTMVGPPMSQKEALSLPKTAPRSLSRQVIIKAGVVVPLSPKSPPSLRPLQSLNNIPSFILLKKNFWCAFLCGLDLCPRKSLVVCLL